MDKRIVYQIPGAPASIVIPFECGLTMEKIGEKDVPKGVPFWIIDTADIPADRTFRDAWELDAVALGNPTGFGGAA